MRALGWTFARPRAWAVATAAMLTYAAVFLTVARGIIVDGGGAFSRWGALPLLQIAPDLSWSHLLARFDPPAVLFLSDSIALAPTVPALATALLLGSLLGINAAVAVEALVRPEACATGRPWWAVASLPSLLAGFSCCAPTVLLLAGAQFAVAAIALVPFVVPAAALLMGVALVLSLRRLSASLQLGRGAPLSAGPPLR